MEYVILFHDESMLMVDDEIGKKIIATKSHEIVIDGLLYQRSAIKKVLSRDEFFKQYPDQRPNSMKEFEVEEQRPRTPEELKCMTEGRLRGLEDFINEQAELGITTPVALSIYEHAVKKGANINAVLPAM